MNAKKRIITGHVPVYVTPCEKRLFLSFGKVDGYGNGRKTCLMEIEISIERKKEGPVFSACGEVWNNIGTDIIMGGQCLDTLCMFAEKWARPVRTVYERIHSLWKRYHLNDMHAGTEEQEACLRAGCPDAHEYDEQCEYLKAKGLYEVQLDGKPYRYGERWLYRPLPPNVLDAIECMFELKLEAPKGVPRDLTNDLLRVLEGVA